MPGEFWADRIKKLRDQPRERVELARENLPLPAAFREAAIGLRALIRERRRDDEDYEELLGQLYTLACIHNFFYATPRTGNEPSFNFAMYVPLEEVEALEFPYQEIGLDELDLLKKTDRKWMRQAWGNPGAAQSVRRFHAETWEGWCGKFIEARRADKEARMAELEDLFQGAKQTAELENSGCLSVILLGLGPVLVTALVHIV